MKRAVAQRAKARTYRISTQISEYHGLRLEHIHMLLRHDCGKKRTLGEIIELAIDNLESKYGVNQEVISPLIEEEQRT